jgi:hypothetical protein
MHRIEIKVHGPNDYDVLLFDERNTHLREFSMSHISPIRAYVFIRGLGGIFKPGINDAESIAAWNYIVAIVNAEGNKN